jgi:small-conductance mechanosensitive channel
VNDALEAQMRSMLLDAWRDLQQPGLAWQVAAIVACLAVSWAASRALRRRAPGEAPARWRFGVEGLKRVLWPLLAIVLVAIAREALRPFHPVNLLSLALPLLGSLVIVRVLVYGLRYSFAPSGLLATFERLIAVAVWGAVALHIVGVLPEVIDALDSVGVVVGRTRLSVWVVLQATFWVTVTILAALWAGSAIEARLMRSETLDVNLRVALARFAQAALVFVAVVVVLPIVGIDLTVLSVFGGALGVGIGIGLQKIASNYVSGFILLLERSIRMGDMITADGFYGVVKAISSRYVVVRALDGREAIIPNEVLVTSKVLNHSYSDRRVAQTLQVQVRYESDVERAIAVTQECAAARARVLEYPAPQAFVTAFADSGVALDLVYWIEDPDQGTAGVRSDIALAILREFRREGIEIPYPQREIRLLQGGEAGSGPGTTPGTR